MVAVGVDGESADGLAVAVKVAGKALVEGVLADGIEVGDGAHVDVGAEAEIGAGEAGAGIHLGGEHLQAFGRGDDVGLVARAVVVGAGLPVRGVGGGRGDGGRHGGIGGGEDERVAVHGGAAGGGVDDAPVRGHGVGVGKVEGAAGGVVAGAVDDDAVHRGGGDGDARVGGDGEDVVDAVVVHPRKGAAGAAGEFYFLSIGRADPAVAVMAVRNGAVVVADDDAGAGG